MHLALGWVLLTGVLCALGFYLVGCFLLRGKDAQGTLGSFLLKGAQGTWVCLCTWWFVVVFDLVLDC